VSDGRPGEASAAPVSGTHGSGARRDLADAVRSLLPVVTLTTAGDDVLGQAAALVKGAVALLATATRSSRYDGIAGLAPGIGINDAVWETHAIYGRSQPLAPPVRVIEEPGHLEATLTFSPAYEGGPGSVYGGFIAAVVDGVCGRAVIGAGHLAVTRSLAVRYLKPTPLETEVRVDALVGEISGRDVPVHARMQAADTVTCEADAVFTIINADHYTRRARDGS
jgi:acyl-coenzyme A thioesterase PaaI-like protein